MGSTGQCAWELACGSSPPRHCARRVSVYHSAGDGRLRGRQSPRRLYRSGCRYNGRREDERAAYLVPVAREIQIQGRSLYLCRGNESYINRGGCGKVGRRLHARVLRDEMKRGEIDGRNRLRRRVDRGNRRRVDEVVGDGRCKRLTVREEKRFGDLAKKNTRSGTGSTRGKYIYIYYRVSRIL
jgi:hypothetical protein